MDKLLEIQDLYVQYNTDDGIVHALNGFNLAVNHGAKLGLVGETGAGKTTMALSILRLLPEKVGQITNGEIVYDGLDILNATKKQLRNVRGANISMISQDPMTSLNPVVTVGEQIREVLELHFPEINSDEKDEKVDGMMTLVGIPPSRKHEYPHQFSGGMRQRVVIAMALIAKPKLLIADEPTTALDVTIQAQILALMKQLKDEFDSAIILITHDLGVVAEFCDEVAIAYAGEIIERGTIEDVYSKTQNHPYTEGLFNCIPELTVDMERLIPILGALPDPTNLPIGCKFALRCKDCMEICKQINPELYTRGTHGIKCHKFKQWGGKKGDKHPAY